MPFLIFRRDHLRSTSGIICGSGSFAVQFGDHFRSGDHLRSGIICGAVQNSEFNPHVLLFLFFFSGGTFYLRFDLNSLSPSFCLFLPLNSYDLSFTCLTDMINGCFIRKTSTQCSHWTGSTKFPRYASYCACSLDTGVVSCLIEAVVDTVRSIERRKLSLSISH